MAIDRSEDGSGVAVGVNAAPVARSITCHVTGSAGSVDFTIETPTGSGLTISENTSRGSYAIANRGPDGVWEEGSRPPALGSRCS
ncbi:MAG: hypothetical protein ACRDQD_25020 [Nocardioidaceae bacterium]